MLPSLMRESSNLSRLRDIQYPTDLPESAMSARRVVDPRLTGVHASLETVSTSPIPNLVLLRYPGAGAGK